MGLSERKSKQKIGDDPRNTKWAKNQSNPGFKILSSMGWTPSTTCLGASANSLEPVKSSWKRLPGSALPIIKSTTSGLGCNPSQVSSNSYLLGAPRFVPSSQSIQSVSTAVESTIENDPDRSNKVAIVANAGGFDDLLSRLNNQTRQSNNKLKSIEENDPVTDSFVVVSLDDTTKLINDDHQKQQLRSSIITDTTNQTSRVRKRVRILEFCHNPIQYSRVEKNQELVPPKSKKIKKNHHLNGQDDKKVIDPVQLYDGDEDNQERRKKRFKKDKQTTSVNGSNNKMKKSSSSLISNLVDHLRKPEVPTNENETHQQKQQLQQQQQVTTTTSSSSSSVGIRAPLKISRPINPRVASRAKYINSKKLASSTNSAAMAEILGIPPPTVSA